MNQNEAEIRLDEQRNHNTVTPKAWRARIAELEAASACKTCKDERVVESKPTGTGHSDDLAEYVPCPDCQAASAQPQTRTDHELYDWKTEGYVCAALHRVPIVGCKDCDTAQPQPTGQAGAIREALAEMFAAVESGDLVRDISRDYQPDFVIRMMKLTMTLKKAQEALAAEQYAGQSDK